MRLYVVKVDIFEAASKYAYPVVTHLFQGKTADEAWGYHDAHRRTDSFLRGCEDKSAFKNVRCRTKYTYGWRTRR